jgi:hypothetical protein
MISPIVFHLHDVSLGAANQTEQERPFLAIIPPRGRHIVRSLLSTQPHTLWLQP